MRSIVVVVGTALVVAFAFVIDRSFCCAHDDALGFPAIERDLRSSREG